MYDLKKILWKVKNIPREFLLDQKQKKNDTQEGVGIIEAYSNQSGQIINMIRRYCNVPHDKDLSKILPKSPMNTYRRGQI